MVKERRFAPERTRSYGSQTIETLGRQQWLDRPSYRLEHVLTLIFAAFGRRRERVSNALHGTWLGHPLHPALVAIPVGSWSAATYLDLLGGNRHREAARRLVGMGSGQTSRVDAARQAVAKAHAMLGPDSTRGASCGSDAFFPFPDAVEVCLAAGVTAFAQPGGSIHDADAVAVVDAAGATMVLTGVRHFRH